MTNNLSSYKSDLQTFYDQTVDNDTSVWTATGDKLIDCYIGKYGLYDEVPANDTIYNYSFVIVYVRPS